jgi:hypothetical protein
MRLVRLLALASPLVRHRACPLLDADAPVRPYLSECSDTAAAANRYERYFGGWRIDERPTRIM